jgi:hypothetical protein
MNYLAIPETYRRQQNSKMSLWALTINRKLQIHLKNNQILTSSWKLWYSIIYQRPLFVLPFIHLADKIAITTLEHQWHGNSQKPIVSMIQYTNLKNNSTMWPVKYPKIQSNKKNRFHDIVVFVSWIQAEVR